MGNKSYNILLTCSGGGLTPYLINSLKKSNRHKNLKILSVDYKENAIGKYFSDFFEQVPYGKSRKYITKILYLCKKYKIHLVIPTSDEEAVNISKNREKFEKKNIKITCVDHKILKIFSNKILTYKSLTELNFTLPSWSGVNNHDEFKKEISKFLKKNRKFVIKPASSRGSRKVKIINPKGVLKNKKKFLDLLSNEYKNSYPLIISSMLRNPVYDLDLLAWKGKLITAVTRRRLIPEDPNGGHIVEKNKKIINFGKKIVKHFNLSWLYDCDFMFDNKQNPILIEINPRMSGSASVSIEAGVPLFEDLISLAMNKKIPKYKIPNKQKIISFKNLSKI